MIVEIGNVLVTTELFSERFCCDLSVCKGRCCIEGDAGAPVKTDEIAALEEAYETVREEMSAAARAVVDKQGVVYIDREGDLVTSIVGGRECVFSCRGDIKVPSEEVKARANEDKRVHSFCRVQPRLDIVKDCCLCLLERRFNEERTAFVKPMSCALYPLREKQLSNGMTALDYNKWEICNAARTKGTRLDIPLYKFLRGPLLRRFGEKWVKEMELVAKELPEKYLKP